MRAFKIFGIVMAFVVLGLLIFGAGYQTNIYTLPGGDSMVVASGGEIEVQSGGELQLQAGSTFELHGYTYGDTVVNTDPGAATLAVQFDGIDTTDLMMVTLQTAPSNGAYFLSAVIDAAGTGTITFSADPAEPVKTFIQFWMD